jgi:nitrite reductase/ring-hydroxylating ferredoxin subunit/DMSO/TMAO reductase YedYZ heme-binding membrane subunit
MGVEYVSVQWNRQKKIYDTVLAACVVTYLALFAVLTKVLHPLVTDEILIMRSFGSASFILLHIILCIGPLCRLNRNFLPLLYNRRHLGVTMFTLALIHAVFVVATYHAASDTNPILSIFVSSPLSPSVLGVPFQVFGFFALAILFLMAATSHDFWLANLSAPVWKSLHMLVYIAYALLVLHVTFGILQGETNAFYAGATAIGFSTVLSLHLLSAKRERALDDSDTSDTSDDYIDACSLRDIPENRARIVCISGERVAIFKYDGKISAVSNVCQHQNGPLGEGKIVYGCITCPWHGYQYQPDTGASPPPFVEKVPTFNVRIKNGRVFVHPKPNPAGARAEPAVIQTATVTA